MSRIIGLSEKKKALANTNLSINKRFARKDGQPVIQTGTEAEKSGKLTKSRYATPSLEFNDMLNGGFCGIVELYGPTGSGKTSLAIETIAMNQKQNPDFIAAWLETEGSVTIDILKLHNVDLDRLIYWSQEDVGSAESSLDIYRSIISSGAIDMIVVNSVAGLTPKTEIADDLDKQGMALLARLMSKFLKIANIDIAKNDICAIFINQIRENIGVMYGDNKTTPGGLALRHYANQRIAMNRVKLQASDPITEDEGLKVSCIVKKNRFGNRNPMKKCNYYAKYDTGIDSIVALPTLLAANNIVRQAGAWWYYEDNQGNLITRNGIPCKWRSQNAFIEALRNNAFLKEEFMNLLNGKAVSQNQTEEEKRSAEIENKQISDFMYEQERIEEGEDIIKTLEENEGLI